MSLDSQARGPDAPHSSTYLSGLYIPRGYQRPHLCAPGIPTFTTLSIAFARLPRHSPLEDSMRAQLTRKRGLRRSGVERDV